MTTIRVAVFQILTRAAYHDAHLNFMKEPADGLVKLCSLPINQIVRSLRKDLKSAHITHISRKVIAGLKECEKLGVDLVILPEYSIPAEILPSIKAFLDNSSPMCIVAGTHMITERCATAYEESGLDALLDDSGRVKHNLIRQAIAPVFLPNGSVSIIGKRNASKWEAHLLSCSLPWSWIEVHNNEKSFSLAVKICIDALNEDLPENISNLPGILAITARSTQAHYFETTATAMLNRGLPVAFCNEGKTGQSRIFGRSMRDSFNIFLSGSGIGSIELDSDSEGIIVADLLLGQQHGTFGTTRNHEAIKVVSLLPIIYGEEIAAATKIGGGDSSLAHLPDLCQALRESSYVKSSLASLKLMQLEALLDSGTANANDARFALSGVFLSGENDDFFLHEYRSLVKTQAVLAKLVTLPEIGRSILESLSSAMEAIPKFEAKHGFNRTVPLIADDATRADLMMRPFVGRDGDIAEFLGFVNDPDAKVIIVSGMRGIGKSAFLAEGLRKAFPPSWTRLDIAITDGTGFERFIMMVCQQLGIPISEGDVSHLCDLELDRLLCRIASSFNSLPSAYMTIDDWHHVLSRREYRDSRFVRFLEVVSRTANESNNKVVLASNVRLSIDGFRYNCLDLQPLDGGSLRAIIEWNIRSTRGGSMPVHVPEELIRRLHGSPLAASIAVSLILKFPVEKMLENTQVRQRYHNRLIPLLVEKIDLTEEELMLARYMSVFNLPITIDAVELLLGGNFVEAMEGLLDYYIVTFNPQIEEYSMHPLVRDYFLDKFHDEETSRHHKLAAKYYEDRVAKLNRPEDKGELVAHLAHSLQYERVRELRSIFTDELRPVAKRFYKAREYCTALHYYKILDQIRTDCDIKLHLALCYVYLDDLFLAERYFEQTIGINKDAWWAMAGYGHALGRKRHFASAQQYLVQAIEVAERLRIPDARQSVIYQWLAYIVANQGDHGRAEENHRIALRLDPDSAFNHLNYADYLYSQGAFEAAEYHIGLAERIDSSIQRIHTLKKKIKSKLDNTEWKGCLFEEEVGGRNR